MSAPVGPKMAEKVRQMKWFEEYRCGCVSGEVRSKKELFGYCPKHGDSAINRFVVGNGKTFLPIPLLSDPCKGEQ